MNYNEDISKTLQDIIDELEEEIIDGIEIKFANEAEDVWKEAIL